jgi:predicted phage terminase large subunit-like protein
MLTASVEEYDALTRVDFNVFVERVFVELKGSARYLDNFHIAVICAELEAVRLGETRRLAIALPPRSLKSIIVSVAWPAWLLGHNPAFEIICASYGQQLADELARDCRQVMQSAWYRRLFPGTRLADNRQAVAAFETTVGGRRRATSVGGAVTGFGADFFIVDDPTKPEEAQSDVERARANSWARHTLFTRLDNKVQGPIVLVMQRLHENDMIGFVGTLTALKIVAFPAIAQEDEEHRISTPHGVRIHHRAVGEALHPEREPLYVLEELRSVLGTLFFSAQYLQMPAPPGGSMVKPEWFQRFDPANPPVFEQIVQSWDTANRKSELSAHSVCTTWGKKGKQIFLLNVLRQRLEYPDLKRAVIAQAAMFDAKTVLIEDAASGIALIQELTREGFYKAQAVKPKGEKVMRMQTQTAVIEAGMVFVPSSASWLEAYLHELMMFPAGTYNDQVDSTSQALAFLTGNNDFGFAAWKEWATADLARGRGEEVPTIRVNHSDLGMQFGLLYGRQAAREADGSFLVTREEYGPIAGVSGLYLVDDPHQRG